jgi:RNA polymerase primary sigma factor
VSVGARNRRLLTAGEERELSRRIARGDLGAKQEMVESNLGLVYFIARRYGGRGVPFEDLVQEGTVGLVQAVERFDHRRNVRLSTYAAPWIRHALVDALAEARAIRIPTKARQQLAALESAEAELRGDVSEAPTMEAISERAGLSVNRVRELHGAPRVTASLDEQVGEDGAPLGELVADPEAVDPWREVDERETRRQLWSMVRILPHRHRKVLIRRYGLDGEGAQSHTEIGRSLGVGEQRSRQLEREALHRLRALGASVPRVAA